MYGFCDEILQSTNERCKNRIAYKKGCKTKCHKHSPFHIYGQCDEHFLDRTKIALGNASEQLNAISANRKQFQKDLDVHFPDIKSITHK